MSKSAIAPGWLVAASSPIKPTCMASAVRNNPPRPIRCPSGIAAQEVATETSIIAAVTAPLTAGASPPRPRPSSASRMKGWPKTNGTWLSPYMPTERAKSQINTGLRAA